MEKHQGHHSVEVEADIRMKLINLLDQEVAHQI